MNLQIQFFAKLNGPEIFTPFLIFFNLFRPKKIALGEFYDHFFGCTVVNSLGTMGQTF
jgi:hypothetical protein